MEVLTTLTIKERFARILINAGTFHRGAGILHRIQQVTEYYSWEEQIYKSLDHLIQDSRGGCSFQASQAVGQRRSGD